MSFFGEQAFTAMKSSEAEMQDSSGSAADSDKKVIPDVPSEVMTKGTREEWVRKTKRALTPVGAGSAAQLPAGCMV